MRLFVAINFSEDIKNTLLHSIAELRVQSNFGNFTHPENLHLTLAFIGESSDVKSIRDAIDKSSAKPFPLAVSGSGHFGNLYWVGIENNPELKTLAQSLQKNLRERGFVLEERAFKPHITIARELSSNAQINLNVPRTSMTVNRISLMKSERINGRLTYTEVYGCMLQ